MDIQVKNLDVNRGWVAQLEQNTRPCHLTTTMVYLQVVRLGDSKVFRPYDRLYEVESLAYPHVKGKHREADLKDSS